jgi:hypothetical protein
MKMLVALLAALHVAVAVAAPPGAKSVERLLDAMEADKTIAGAQQYADAMIKGTVEQVGKVRPVTPEQRTKLEAASASIAAAAREQLAKAKLRPLMAQIYAESFTQEEVDGLIAFYGSPAGRAFLAKMPLVLQKTSTLMQQRVGDLTEKLQAAIRETFAGT